MTSDTRRLQGSTVASSAFHAGLLGLYLLLKSTSAQNQPVITRVEFLDLHAPPQEAAAAPARSAPRGIRDFLRMAIPRFRSNDVVQEAQPQEMTTDRSVTDARFAQQKSIKLDSRTLSHGGSIKLRSTALDRSAAALSDLGSTSKATASAELSTPNEVPSPEINLEAVGRKAVRGSGGPAIRLDRGGPSRQAASLNDIAAASGQGAAPSDLADAGTSASISLDKGGKLSRSGQMPSLPVGYGGGSGSISLSDKPTAHGSGSGFATADASSAREENLQSQPKKRSNKAIEISGPLAHRKIVTMQLPAYPDWARAQGIEAEVVIRFFVSSDGTVIERMILERTSGYKELDDLSMETLKKWVFVALPDQEADQWGIITFRFRLK